MKKCARCGEFKDESEFNWRWQDTGIRQSVCRECQKGDRRDYYLSHQDDERERSKNVRQMASEEAQKFIYEYLSYSTCKDCGEYDFSVLTFDHVRGKKSHDISTMAAQGYSIEAIKAEIELCEVVCWNCHMRRENERRSGGRFRRFWPKFPWEE